MRSAQKTDEYEIAKASFTPPRPIARNLRPQPAFRRSRLTVVHADRRASTCKRHDVERRRTANRHTARRGSERSGFRANHGMVNQAARRA